MSSCLCGEGQSFDTKLAELTAEVEGKIDRAKDVQTLRRAGNKDTIVQDCKIDAWESVIALIKEAGKYEQTRHPMPR